MEKNKIFKPFVLMMLFLFLPLNGCAPARYVMNWFSPGGYDPVYGNRVTGAELSVSDIDKVYKRACYFQEQKKYQLSINEFQKVVSNDPAHALAYNGMGVSYDLMGDYRNAVQAYQHALAIDQGLDYVHNNLGYSYSLQGMTDEAIEEYKKAIELNPEAGKYHNNLGRAYVQNGDYELALAEFKKTTDESGAHEMLANILYKKGLYSEARAQFAEASKLNPYSSDLKNGLKASTKLAKINQDNAEKKENTADVERAPDDNGLQITGNDKADAGSSDNSYVKNISPEGSVIIREQIIMDEKQDAQIASPYIVMVQPADPMTLRKTETFTVKEAAGTSAEEQGAVISVNTSQTENENSTSGAQKGEVLVSASLVPSPANVIVVTTGAETLTAAPVSKETASPRVSNLAGMIVKLISDYPDHPLIKKIAARLINKGFVVEKETNDGRYNRSETKLYYCIERLQEAYQAAKSVPGYQNMDKFECDEAESHVIKVVVGRDLIPATQNLADQADAGKLGV